FRRIQLRVGDRNPPIIVKDTDRFTGKPDSMLALIRFSLRAIPFESRHIDQCTYISSSLTSRLIRLTADRSSLPLPKPELRKNRLSLRTDQKIQEFARGLGISRSRRNSGFLRDRLVPVVRHQAFHPQQRDTRSLASQYLQPAD